MKYLRVTMPDGIRWDVPAEVVARHKATFYKVSDPDMEAEIKVIMEIDYELKDWAENNMNWSDVESVAKKAEMIPPPPIHYQDGWVNGHKEILDY